MNPASRIMRSLAVTCVVVVLLAVCSSAVAAVPQPAPSGSIAAPSMRLVDLHSAPSTVRTGPSALAKLAGWFVGAVCAALLLGVFSVVPRQIGARRPSPGLLSFPLRT